MSGPLTLAGNPTDSHHAANKAYVDTYLAGLALDTSALSSITNNQVLGWNSTSSKWTPISVVGAANATQLQGVNIDSTAPTANQVLYYNSGISKWTAGTTPVPGGGTGATSLTSNGILYGNGTGAIQAAAAMTNGQLLIGQTGSAPAPTTVTGDVTLSNTGVTTIGANKVTAAMLANNVLTSSQISTTGGVATYSVISPTTHTTLTSGQNVVLANASSGAITITLPAVGAAGTGQVYTVKKTDSSTYAVTISPASGTIDGSASIALKAQYASVQLATDGVNWFKLSATQTTGSSFAYLSNINGWGSTGTKIPRFGSTSSQGGDLTINQSAVSGDSITVNTTGTYWVGGWCSYGSASNVATQITVNTTDNGSTDALTGGMIDGMILKIQTGLESNITYGGNGSVANGIFSFTAADVVRMHCRGSANSSATFSPYNYFKIVRLW